MDLGEIEHLRADLNEFVTDVFASIRRSDQRRWGQCYLRGLMLDGRRKSIQPMAARLPDGNMQALQQFVNHSPWQHTPLLRQIAQRLTPVIDPQVWIIDDVAFPKWGTSSLALAPQYCPALGKQANCQVAVSVHAATDTASVPLSWRLFLPLEWAAHRARCRPVGVPEQVGHVKKWRLALEILEEVRGWDLVPPVIVADAGYGQNAYFRAALVERGLSFVVAVRGDEVAPPQRAISFKPDYAGQGPPPKARYRDKPAAFSVLATAGGREQFTEVRWREGRSGRCARVFASLPCVQPGWPADAWPLGRPGTLVEAGTVSCPWPRCWSNGLRTPSGRRSTG
jgi:SRSO17 transposase